MHHVFKSIVCNWQACLKGKSILGMVRSVVVSMVVVSKGVIKDDSTSDGS